MRFGIRVWGSKVYDLRFGVPGFGFRVWQGKGSGVRSQ